MKKIIKNRQRKRFSFFSHKEMESESSEMKKKPHRKKKLQTSPKKVKKLSVMMKEWNEEKHLI